MKANKKVLAALLAAMMTVSTAATMVSAAASVEAPGAGSSNSNIWSQGTWYSQTVDGTKFFYYVKADGSTPKGWEKINDKWYFFNAIVSHTVAINGNISVQASPAVINDVVTINEAAKTAASVATGTVVADSYRFLSDGSMVTGWYNNASNASTPSGGSAGWEYHAADGKRKLGWIKDGAAWYYIVDGNDVVAKLNSDGSVAATTLKIGDMLADATYRIGKEADGTKNPKYTFAKNGMMSNTGLGWVKQDGRWSYVDADGKRTTGWKEINGKWYYFAKGDHGNTAGTIYKAGELVTGWFHPVKDDGSEDANWYVSDENGMLTGWQKQGGTWFYLGGNGAMQEGWVLSNGTWYFLNKNVDNNPAVGLVADKAAGAMLTGWQKIDRRDSKGDLYYDWYNFKDNGGMSTGWVKTNSNWYFCKNDGKMVAAPTVDGKSTIAIYSINGKIYAFNSVGVMQTGSVNYNGQTLVFGADGSLVSGDINTSDAGIPTL